MIRQVKILNFRGLRKVSVPLRPLTVLLGPNDSGKTSFLDAVYLHLRRQGYQPDDAWRHADRPEVQTLVNATDTYEGSVELFQLPSRGIPMGSKGVADKAQREAPALSSTGENLAAFVDYLLRWDRARFDLIQALLRDLVPGFEEIRIATPSAEERYTWLSIENGLQIPGERLSTGVRMLLFFVALAHHPNPPDVVLIEEPESGVHPKRLKDIVELLRSLTEGKLGKAVQVIMTTHSPYLLDHIKLPQDQVLVFRREDDGQRTATPADQDRLKAFLDEFMLGEVWFNRGEEGLVKSAK